MILESINEPTATVTLTVTEMRRIRDGHSWALEGLEGLPENHPARQLHEKLRLFFIETIEDTKTIYP